MAFLKPEKLQYKNKSEPQEYDYELLTTPAPLEADPEGGGDGNPDRPNKPQGSHFNNRPKKENRGSTTTPVAMTPQTSPRAVGERDVTEIFCVSRDTEKLALCIM